MKLEYILLNSSSSFDYIKSFSLWYFQSRKVAPSLIIYIVYMALFQQAAFF